MLFAFIEDGTLEVLADRAEALSRFEPVDVESGTVVFYDDRGRPLTPVFPHRSERRFLGFRLDSDPGPYEFEPSTDATATPLETALVEAAAMTPNAWFSTLDDVRAHLSARRASDTGE